MSKNNEKFFAIITGTERVIAQPIFEFAIIRSNHNYLRIVFVEGESDRQFYSGNLYKSLKVPQDSVAFISNRPRGGKEFVFRLYRFVKDKSAGQLNQCAFIVDRDYDDLDGAYKYITSSELDHLTMLPCYSFENYFLYKENLLKLFKELDEKNGDVIYERFTKGYTLFLDQIKEYCALKRVIVKNNLHIQSVKVIDEVIEKWADSDALELKTLRREDIESVIAELSRQDGSYYEEYLKSIDFLRNNPHRIKGKILFDYLMKFIKKDLRLAVQKRALYEKGSVLNLELNVAQCK